MQRSNGPRQHVFISYARSDGELFARQLHERLEKEHLPCWRDRLDLEGGVDFWRQLETAIAVARWLVIILTPRALKSEWTAREWWEARKHGVPICPVWPLEETALAANLVASRLPAGMRRSHVYMPFTAGKGSEVRADEEWRNLLSTLRLDKEVTRTLFMAPPLPPDYIDRPEETNLALSALLPAPEGQRPAITALHGAGGMGKTTLAKALALRDEITDAFHDGVLWITLGTRPVLVDIVADLCRALGRYGHFSDIDAAASHLRAVLENRFCLLVVDDVWQVSDLQPFIGLGPTVAVLVTTRVAEVARLAGEGGRAPVGQMTRDQSANYLFGIVGSNARVRHRCSQLARKLGHWPLLLRLAGGQLRAQLDYGESPETAIDWVGKTLRQSGVTALDADPSADDFENTRTRDRAVAVSIGGSLGLLSGAEREAFLDLGVFPDDVDIPLSTAAQLWAVPDGRNIALRLANLSLVDLHLGKTPSLRLHDQIHHFAAQRLQDDGRWLQTHRRLVMTWNDLSNLPNDYAWRWVCHHLKEAGLEDRLATLLSDYDAIAKRLRAKSAGAHRLAADYEFIGELPDGAHIGRVIQRASHILASQPDLLSQQLVGRLTRKSSVCDSLRERARARNPRFALLPLTPSLTTQLSTFRQVLRHDNEVSAMALTGDGRIVTGGRDGRIFLAQLQGGEPVLLAHHRDAWSVLLLTSDLRVVAGGRDGRVYCLSLDGGEPIVLSKHLGGLVGTVSHLVLTGDGRIVSAAWDGAVYLATLDGDGARLLVRHEGMVTTLAVVPDGRIVTGGQDGRVYCTRLDGGEPIILVEHECSNDGGAFAVGQLVLTGDGRVLSSGERDGRVYCVPLDGGEPVLLAQHRGPVSTLLLLGDGRVITGGRVDGRICCVPLEGGTLRVIAEDTRGVRYAALTRDGGIVFVAGTPDHQRLYRASLESGQAVLLAEYTQSVSRMLLTDDGRVIIATEGGRVDCFNGSELTPVTKHEGSVSCLALTGDGAVVTGGHDGRVYYATLDGQDQATTTQPDDLLTTLMLTLDGRVVTASVNGRVHCGRLRDGALTLIAQHDYPVTNLLLTGDGRVLTGGQDGRVICSRLDGGGRVELVRHRGIVTELHLLGSGRVLTQGEDWKVWCAGLDGSDLRLIADRSAFRIRAVTKDERVVSLVEDDKSERVYCARIDGGEAELIAVLDGRVSTLALSPDGRVITGSDDGRIYCTPLSTGVPILLASHPERVDQLMLTGDGRVLIVWSDGRMCCARLEGGDLLELATLSFMRQPLLDGAGNVVYVTGGWAETVCIVGLDGGPPRSLIEHSKGVARLVLTGDGRVVTGGRDGRVCCTRLQDGVSAFVAEHGGDVATINVIDRGRLVVSTGREGALMVTDLSGALPQRVFVADMGFTHVEFDAVERVAVAADGGGNVHMLPIPPV